MTRAFLIAGLLLSIPLAHDGLAARQAKSAKVKKSTSKKDVVTGNTLRLPGVTTGLKLPPQGKATKVSQDTADGIARGLSDGEGWRPIAFSTEAAGYKPHNGDHFPVFEIKLQGTLYHAYVRNTPTLSHLMGSKLKSVEVGERVILHNPKTNEWSDTFDIKREVRGNFLAGF
jgi:hypothetical protein